MPTVTFIQPDGVSRAVDIANNCTVMSGAMMHNVRGIAAECGGGLACATCHVYVDPAWFDRLTPARSDEAEMLEMAAAELHPTSRLSCQIMMTPALDGLLVTVPPPRAEPRMAGLVIVGASYAAVQVAATAREAGCDGAIRMVGDEPAPPYQRPPLSKGYLTGKVADAALPLRGPAFYADNRIELSLGAPVMALDLEGRAVRTATDRFPYDALVLATGSRARPLPAPGAGLAGVHVLRTVADAARLRDEMGALLQQEAGKRAVVIGGGYVGLEVAASLRAGGAEVVVLEFGPRVLNRVATPPFADFVAGAHRARGVTLLTGVQALALDGHAGHVTAMRCSDGVTRPADLVVVGIGAIPNSELAAAAGIACEAGAIAVDGHGRTSAPDVYAAGDCACLTGSAQRLESIQNANDQGRAAGLSIAGQTPPPMGVPWFWSDQFDLKLQMAGLTQGYDRCVTRGSVADSRFSLFYFAGARLLAVDSVNRPAEHMLARKLIAGGATLPFEDVTDSESDLRRFA